MMIWKIRRLILFFLSPLIFFSLVFYFGYHMVKGERGLLALTHSTKKLKEAEAYLKALTREKEILENKVSLMGDKIDLSLLDLQVRLILGYVHPSELIIIPSPQATDSQ